MKRATAIGHLVEIAGVASERLALRETDIGWPLEELWATGDLLTSATALEVGSVVLVLDTPPDQLPWLALNPDGEFVGDILRMGRRPLLWCYRPLAWPVWTYRHRSLVRFWSADGGLDDAVIDALRTRDLDGLPVEAPTAALLAEQVGEELVVSGRHLRHVLHRYWDHDWRHENKGVDYSPEDALWRAATAVTEMQDALAELERGLPAGT